MKKNLIKLVYNLIAMFITSVVIAFGFLVAMKLFLLLID